MFNRHSTSIHYIMILSMLLMVLSACAVSPVENINQTPSPRLTITERTATLTITAIVPTPGATITPVVITQTPNITPTSEQDGCKKPGEDYERVTINNHRLNRRTLEMLAYAQSIYGGIIDITGDAITQGSYTEAVDASFGTHAGGGAVDLSVMAPGTFNILHEDIEPLVQALRLAGFAAWYRDFDDLYPGSPVHIHAIAIGDRELSWPARLQLEGPHGYFLGFDGLPAEKPRRDPHAGPVVCDWMLKMGYPSSTATPFYSE